MRFLPKGMVSEILLNILNINQLSGLSFDNTFSIVFIYCSSLQMFFFQVDCDLDLCDQRITR